MDTKKTLSDMIYRMSCDAWRLQYAIKKPSEIDSMFCIPSWTGNDAVFAQQMLTYLEELEDNTTLYICGVFDYHF